MRHMGHDRDHRVMTFRRQRHHLGAEPGDDRTDLGERVVVGGGDGSEHPGSALEQIGPRSGQALELAPGHRVATHVARIGHERHHRRLDAPGVGDQSGRRSEGPGHDLGHRSHRRGDDGELDVVAVAPDRVDDLAFERALHPSLVGIATEHDPSGGAQRERHRSSDEAESDHQGPSSRAHQSARSLRSEVARSR